MTEQQPRQPRDGQQTPKRQGQPSRPVNDQERGRRDREDVVDVDVVDDAIEDARENEGLSEQPD